MVASRFDVHPVIDEFYFSMVIGTPPRSVRMLWRSVNPPYYDPSVRIAHGT
jgi:hypothetical protein